MELYKGRPEDTSGRLEREIRTYDFLDKLGMTFWRTGPRRTSPRAIWRRATT